MPNIYEDYLGGVRVKFPSTRPGNTIPGLSEDEIEQLKIVLSQREGVLFTRCTTLRFTRPAVCLVTDSGYQKTLAVESAKQLLKETQNESNTCCSQCFLLRIGGGNDRKI
jgi:hypothetical protein